MSINAIMTVAVFIVIFVYGFKLYNLHERIAELEKEVYIYLDPKIKEIVNEATLKEGDNT